MPNRARRAAAATGGPIGSESSGDSFGTMTELGRAGWGPGSGRRSGRTWDRRRAAQGAAGARKETEQSRGPARHGVNSRPEKFHAEGAAPGQPGEVPGRAIEMAGPRIRSRAVRRDAAHTQRAAAVGTGPKAPARGGSGPPTNPGKNRYFTPGRVLKGGFPATPVLPPAVRTTFAQSTQKAWSKK